MKCIISYAGSSDEVDARQVDTGDHDGLCDLIAWSGGLAVGPEDTGDEDAVIEVNGQVAAHGDWLVRLPNGDVWVRTDGQFRAFYVPADGEDVPA